MKVEEFAIADLSPDPANARAHSRKNLDAIKSSLKRFGQQKPIVIDSDMIVVAGNGTLEAAKELGWDKIKAWKTTLKGADRIAFAIADNRTAELAEWDEDTLGKLLQGMREDGLDLAEIGFELDDLEDFGVGGESSEEKQAEARRSLSDRFGVCDFGEVEDVG